MTHDASRERLFRMACAGDTAALEALLRRAQREGRFAETWRVLMSQDALRERFRVTQVEDVRGAQLEVHSASVLSHAPWRRVWVGIEGSRVELGPPDAVWWCEVLAGFFDAAEEVSAEVIAAGVFSTPAHTIAAGFLRDQTMPGYYVTPDTLGNMTRPLPLLERDRALEGDAARFASLSAKARSSEVFRGFVTTPPQSPRSERAVWAVNDLVDAAGHAGRFLLTEPFTGAWEEAFREALVFLRDAYIMMDLEGPSGALLRTAVFDGLTPRDG